MVFRSVTRTYKSLTEVLLPAFEVHFTSIIYYIDPYRPGLGYKGKVYIASFIGARFQIIRRTASGYIL